ncbi:hypothetical protein KR018_006705 [Drosophila ironensis]|nr:hypothetical protein KR018_006705 [Drosophila ironensis]
MRLAIFAATLVLLLGSVRPATEHTVTEEWSWQDSEGNGDSGGYQYSYMDENDLGSDEDADEEDEDDIIGLPNVDENEEEDEESCEYSCPRYYQPVCVLRNGKAVTYATSCEYHNQVRCANVLASRGVQQVPTFQFRHQGSC